LTKTKGLPSYVKTIFEEIIRAEEAYHTDFDKCLQVNLKDNVKIDLIILKKKSSFSLFSRKADLTEQYKSIKDKIPDRPDFRPLLDFINCKIRLLHLYVQLYQNSAGKPKIAPDFREFFNLFEMNREDYFKKYLANNEDQDELFCNVKLELQTLEYILQSARDIWELHIISAQITLKRAQMSLKEWNTKLNPSLTRKMSFFDNKTAVPNSYEWLVELHGHLLAKFCLFFYDVFMSTPKIGNLEPAEGFRKLCSQTRFDFYGRVQELFKTMENSSALYLIRDHRPSKSENYSSTSKYVFMPFIEEVTNNDAKGDRIGVVSWYSREGNKTNYDDDEENLKKAFEAYQKKKEEKAARGKNYENWEERVQKWNTRANTMNRTYFLGQVEVLLDFLKKRNQTHFLAFILYHHLFPVRTRSRRQNLCNLQ